MDNDFNSVITQWLDNKNINLKNITKEEILNLCKESWHAGYKYGHNEGYGDGWEDAKNAYY